MLTIGAVVVFFGIYSLIVLKKVEDKNKIYDNINAYVGVALTILLGLCIIVNASSLEDLLRRFLIYLICIALSIVFILYGMLLVTMPLFFRKQVTAKLLRYEIKMEKNYHGCFAYSENGKMVEAESEKISKSKRLKIYEEGKSYPVWVNIKYADICRVSRYKECIIGATYLVAGVGLLCRIITLF